MVQGNWERRAELSEARRLEAKQRKQRNGERKIFKAQAHDLMSFLNRNVDELFRKRKPSNAPKIDDSIHIWTDTPPSSEEDSPLHHRFWEEPTTTNRKTEGRGRSTSFGNVDDSRSSKSNKTKGRQKKKAHPRSKDNPNNNGSNNNGEAGGENISIHTPKLCRSHFFFGKCCDATQRNKGQGGKKNYNCRFLHYPKNYFTIKDVLLTTGFSGGDQETCTSIAKEVIGSSESSYPGSSSVGDNTPSADAMDMMYYLSFRMDELFAGYSDDGQSSSSSISHFLVDAMARQSCNIGSIVYFAVGNQLLYDRYRKGVIVEESELIGFGRNKATTNRSSATDRSIDSMPLSASILEHILSFLGDRAVASMSSVSRSWNREIGKQSGNLWRHLLQRRSWPVPSVDQGHNEDGLSTLRESFISHYTAVRDINGIKKGMDSLIYRKSMNEFEGSVRSFDSVKSSPPENAQCVAIKIWAANSFLAAYSQDCSLRLFDSVEGSESSEERLCRELICYCVDPYRKTKKRNCQLAAVALDKDYIGCLLAVVDEGSDDENYILTVLSREIFLIDDDSDGDAMQVIDIRESVLNFLLSCDDVDHGLLQLHDFLANDGDLDDIEVNVSPSLVECGYGRFMVEVAIAVPSIDIIDDQESVDTLIFRKLFFFSTSAGAIAWMTDSGPSSSLLRSLDEDMTLASFTREDNYRHGYDIVSASCVSPTITNLSVDYGGILQQSTLIQGTDLVRNEILSDQWSLPRSRTRPVLMLEHEVVVADNLICEENGRKKAVVTFYPMDDNSGCSTLKSLELVGNLKVCHLIALRGAHIIAICHVFESTHEGNEDEEFDGHWFGPDNSPMVSSYAIIIDIKSRSEIHRVCFVDNIGQHLGRELIGLSPIQLAVRGNTVAAGLSSKGVVLTGADSRKTHSSTILSREELTTPSKSTKKTKKKKQSKKNGKKDGFARGQKM